MDLCEKIISKGINIQECVNQYENRLALKPPTKIKRELTESERNAIMVPPKKERYTEENIEKAVEKAQVKSRKRFNEKELTLIYNEALAEISSYLQEQGEQINFRDKFYLLLLLSNINNRLGNIKESIDFLNQAETVYYQSNNAKEKWVSELDELSARYNVFESKKARHKRKISGAIYKPKKTEAKISPEKAIASKTYVSQEVSNLLEKVDFIQLFKSFRTSNSTNFTRAILNLHALDSLEHSHFGIYVGTKTLTSDSKLAYYDMKNKVEARVKDIKDTAVITQQALLHELIHKGLDRAFNNGAAPYFKDNIDSKKSLS